MHSPIVDIKNLIHDKLSIAHWQINAGQKACVVGRNGSGKQYLDKMLIDDVTLVSFERFVVPSPEQVKVVSFETLQEVYENELKIDETDITDCIDDGTPARDFLPVNQHQNTLVAQFSLSHVMDKGYRLLSTGESRKLLILKALLDHIESPHLKLLICDNPFDSLDLKSVNELSELLNTLSDYGITVLLCLSNRDDIPAWCEQIAIIDEGKLIDLSGIDEQQIQRQLESLMTDELADVAWPEHIEEPAPYPHDYLVELQNGKVSYQSDIIFSELDFAIKPLQHTLVTGANGCGKSTLLQLVTGDHPQCYNNKLSVLGFARGQGESIWQIKKQMGIVSPEIHRQYRVSCTVLATVVSGFFDSIGVYQQVESKHTDIAKQWLAKIGMLQYSAKLLSDLSFGEQRLVLIVRALVKSPYLLVMDEPTQGLDEVNRHRVLKFLQTLDQQKHSTVLFVSHREDEFIPMFKQHLAM
ncbi:ATP-binding cassette domain-containing protein [Psychrosphaera sp. 1_MG-2023]|uniref:ATP-binding cassette domain-containing protein n=1 Tax=Psychrosphaera sp. 1_MG-2023 TaxID=3062643 RepID=UPI0026E151FB|nr:ATP-binding cassette domain-containing protein [Psychrosphaera sp. 1_MG-2023]MDO6719769.1 ATP-binding cassette domain-containing protein [Psychrosphaera sp. 1_MG-2023]